MKTTSNINSQLPGKIGKKTPPKTKDRHNNNSLKQKALINRKLRRKNTLKPQK
ncbi:hypothetical protein FUAX_30130 [Fulvitalea axinellae]|uniref:Uncharacterized protein n=1 Tax=Fulvitalea axinellae TaxID=1182444 RepID=A0AAU9CEL8_9BACT|nr:hypothetical protein FUAX_30130 [Fulvitalea axinellae]